MTPERQGCLVTSISGFVFLGLALASAAFAAYEWHVDPGSALAALGFAFVTLTAAILFGWSHALMCARHHHPEDDPGSGRH